MPRAILGGCWCRFRPPAVLRPTRLLRLPRTRVTLASIRSCAAAILPRASLRPPTPLCSRTLPPSAPLRAMPSTTPSSLLRLDYPQPAENSLACVQLRRARSLCLSGPFLPYPLIWTLSLISRSPLSLAYTYIVQHIACPLSGVDTRNGNGTQDGRGRWIGYTRVIVAVVTAGFSLLVHMSVYGLFTVFSSFPGVPSRGSSRLQDVKASTFQDFKTSDRDRKTCLSSRLL